MSGSGHGRDRGPDLATLRGICARVGARLVRAHRVDRGHAAFEIDCGSHATKVRLLDELAHYDARSPEVRALAERISEQAGGDPAAIAAAVQRLVQLRVRHIFEAGEVFAHTMRTLEVGRGDCDDTARAIAAILRAIGVPAELVTIDDPPRHVYAAAILDGRRVPLEATIDAMPGEDPQAAARRLGLARADL